MTDSVAKTINNRSPSGFIKAWRAPASVFVTTCLLAMFASTYLARQQEAEIEVRFSSLVEQTVRHLQQRMASYEYGLRGARGAVVAAGPASIDRYHFHAYLKSRNPEQEFPGARGFAFVRRISPGQEPTLIKKLRSEGIQIDRIRQIAPHRGERFVVQYIEPEEKNATAIGLDIASEGNRHDTLWSSIRKGKATLTPPINLVKASGHEAQGFLLMLPIFASGTTPDNEETRQRQAVGVITVPLLIEEALADFDDRQGEFSMALFDGETASDGRPFFTSANFSDSAARRLSRQITLPIYGRNWQIQINATASFMNQLHLLQPWMVGAGMLAVGAMLAILLHFFLRTRQREQELLISQAKAQISAIVDSANDAIIGLWQSGEVMSWNKAAEKLFGYSATEAIGQKLHNLVIPDETQATEAALLRDLADGRELRQLETVYHDRDGRQIDVSITFSPIRSANGEEIVGISKTVRDISQRIRMDAELLAREQRFKDFTESSADWFWETDAIHRFSFLSANSPQILGDRPLAALLGKTRMELALADGTYSDSHWHDHLQALATQRAFRDFEYAVLDSEGKITWLSVSGKPFFNAAGDFCGYRGIGQVVTQRHKEADELALHRSHLELLVEARTEELAITEAQLRSVIDSSGNGIIEIDNAGQVRLANPAACDMLGYQADALIGRDLHATIHHSFPDGTPYAAEHCSTLQAIRLEGGLRGVEDVYWHADGRPLHVIVSAQTIRQGEQVVGSVINFSDITSRKEAEAAREQAREAAEKLARVKSDFLANMSHEIRTPLNGVLGMAQIGYRENLGRRSQEIFSRIIDSGKLLQGIINDILDFSKIEANKLVIESVPVSPRRIIDESINSLAKRAADKGIVLLSEIAPETPLAFLGDPTRLAQILLNLLSNAVKFTAQGEVSLTAQLQGENIVFSVRDTGIGISEEQQARLFQPFEQADSSTTRKYGGTGLGLSISQGLAEMMGGKISVTSQVGYGSTFTLSLSCIAAEPLPADGENPMHSARQAKSLQGLRILVAEDNEVNQLVICDLLNQEGASVKLVGNGLLALNAIASSDIPFDLVLMDVQMPVMDGLVATEQIRARHFDLPIIGQTAHALSEEHQRCRTAGMNDVITKPLDADHLVATILQQLKIRPAKPPRTLAKKLPTDMDNRPQTKTMIDWSLVEQHYLSRPQLLAKICTMLQSSHAETPQAIRDAAAANDAETLANLAHKIKGSAGFLFAVDVVHQAETIDQAYHSKQADIAKHADALANAVQVLLDELAAAERSSTLLVEKH